MLTPERTITQNAILALFRPFADLCAFSRAMTCPVLRTAVAGLGHFAIGPDAGLCVQAPEKAIIAGGDSRIGLGQNELAFPTQVGTQVRMAGIETIRFLDHAAPPEAFKMARVTATFASLTL